MLQVARLAQAPLHDVKDLVATFIQNQLNPDGGFKNRAGESDLYYSVFGLEGLHALMQEIPVEQVGNFLEGFGSGDDLDLVHLCCLARCYSNLPDRDFPTSLRVSIATQFEEFRTEDGGYANFRDGSKGTVYHSFMATNGYQDCLLEAPKVEGIHLCLKALETKDGAYANEVGMTLGTTTSTAAAESLLRNLQWPRSKEMGQWLLKRYHPKGGFLAMPEAPIPDLLSTATALHALSGLKVDFSMIKESCLDYVDSLWNSKGGFHGNWTDEFVDCEYTYYGLLALGHLTL
jgi:prenyltransferase beta subunit